MAEIAGMLAAGVLKVAAGKMAEAAGDRIMLQWKFGEDLEDMEDTVESIQAVLEDAEGQSITNASVRLWLKRLTRASCDISDIFDEFEVNKTRKSFARKLKVLKPCLTLASEVNMASKMMEVREKLEKISNHHHKFSFLAGNSSPVHQVIDERATSSEAIEANIIGRDGEKEELVKRLTSPGTSPELVILPIYGFGGMGKTTLAHLLFNDTHFGDYEKAWIYVGQIFDFEKIKKHVSSELRMESGQVSNTQEPNNGPSSAGKKYLIVLDDLWEKDDTKLGNLKGYLNNLGKGHKLHVIVTTRDGGIAKKIKTTEEHKIEPLSPDVCWDIIKQIVGFEDKNEADRKNLNDIGKVIAEKCGGVALAARAIGYTLRSRNEDGWVSIKNSRIWNQSTSGYTTSSQDNVLASLKLSYSSMPPYQRLCFAYCAIFRKGHKMAKDELIYQWAALGYIKPSDEFPTWQQGEDCIKQLLEMSFLSPSEYSIYDRVQHRKDVTLFTMHDLVHDLARLIMTDEVFYATEAKSEGRKYRYAVLKDCTKPLNSSVIYPNKIRALQILGNGRFERCHAGLFSTAKYLKILDFEEYSIKKLPSSIGQLKLLMYLNAPGINDRKFPRCLTKLSKLQYLNLRRSSDLLELPQSIGEMEGLMYLDLSQCCKIKMLPESFGQLENLVHLDLSKCYRLKVTPGVLCNLIKLEYLNLSDHFWLPKELHEAIGELTDKLRYLNLSRCFGLQWFSSDDLGVVFDKISTLSNLEHLDFSCNTSFETLPDSVCSLRKLHMLDLTLCEDLISLPENMGLMENLKFLITTCCSKLDVSTLPANKKLISLPNFAVHAAEDASNLMLLKDVSTSELAICRLENVKSLEEGRQIKLRERHSLLELTLDWTTGLQGFVEDMELLVELVPPSSLPSFFLRGYNSVIFPPWLLDGITCYLPNLVNFGLKGLPQCRCLPPLGQLPNLRSLSLEGMPSVTKIDRGFCGDGKIKAFTKLEHLTIYDMENLEEWRTTYCCDEGGADEIMFPNLENLEIRKCPKLIVDPCPPRVRGTWTIQDCDNVLLQWGESAPHHDVCSTSAAPLVHTLKVVSSMEPLHQWKLLYRLHGLHSLSIKSCSDLSSSPEILGVLASLQLLSFLEIEAPPQWFGDCVSLKELEIEDCRGTFFVESIQQLTNLESLALRRCPGLFKWIELKENKTKFGHIKKIEVDYMVLRDRGH